MVIRDEVFYRPYNAVGLLCEILAPRAYGFCASNIAYAVPGSIPSQTLVAYALEPRFCSTTQGEYPCEILTCHLEHVRGLHKIARPFVLLVYRVARIQRICGI